MTSARLLPLDVLRALAIVLVLGNHMLDAPRSITPAVRLPLVLWERTGWVGVDLFFVLSGFLVSGLIFREHFQLGRISFKRFLVRRGLKIYPALYFLVLVTVVVRLVAGTPIETNQVLGELLFLQNYVGALWGHTWSLAVEEHFYLSLALLLLLLLRRDRTGAPFRHLPGIAIALVVGELALRIITFLMVQYSPGTHAFPSHLRFDSLFFGVLLSYYYHYHQARFVAFFRKWGRPLSAVGLVVALGVLLLPRNHFLVSTLGFSWVFLTGGVVLSCLLVFPFPSGKMMRWIGFVGAHSYSIYLWHYAMVHWVAEPLEARGVNWFVFTGSYMALSMAVGIAMAKLVEFPVLHLRDRWFPSLSRPLKAVSTRPPALDEQQEAEVVRSRQSP